jgi:hypothetical protein
MGRPPIGERAMTAAERQRRRYWANRTRPAPTPPVAPVHVARPEPLASPASVATANLAGLTINAEHLRRWPVEVFRWYRDRFGVQAVRVVRDAADQVLNEEGEVLVPRHSAEG